MQIVMYNTAQENESVEAFAQQNEENSIVDLIFWSGF